MRDVLSGQLSGSALAVACVTAAAQRADFTPAGAGNRRVDRPRESAEPGAHHGGAERGFISPAGTDRRGEGPGPRAVLLGAAGVSGAKVSALHYVRTVSSLSGNSSPAYESFGGLRSVACHGDYATNTIVIRRTYLHSLRGEQLISASMERRRTGVGRIRMDF